MVDTNTDVEILNHGEYILPYIEVQIISTFKLCNFHMQKLKLK